jgi:hypothetical protein
VYQYLKGACASCAGDVPVSPARQPLPRRPGRTSDLAACQRAPPSCTLCRSPRPPAPCAFVPALPAPPPPHLTTTHQHTAANTPPLSNTNAHPSHLTTNRRPSPPLTTTTTTAPPPQWNFSAYFVVDRQGRVVERAQRNPLMDEAKLAALLAEGA